MNDDTCPKCNKKSMNADSERYFRRNDEHGYTNENYSGSCDCRWLSEYVWHKNIIQEFE